jgi:hypothetical protein
MSPVDSPKSDPLQSVFHLECETKNTLSNYYIRHLRIDYIKYLLVGSQVTAPGHIHMQEVSYLLCIPIPIESIYWENDRLVKVSFRRVAGQVTGYAVVRSI